MQKPPSYQESISEQNGNDALPSYEDAVRPGSPEPQPPIIEPSDVKQSDPFVAPGQEDMPPPIPAHYLKKQPVSDKNQKITHNQNRQELLPAQDQKQVPHRLRPASIISSIGSLRVNKRQVKKVEGLIPRIVFWEQDLQRLPQLFFDNPHPVLNDKLFPFFIRGSFEVDVRLVFILRHKSSDTPKKFQPHMILTRGDQPCRIHLGDFYEQCGRDRRLLRSIDEVSLNSVEIIKSILEKIVSELLVTKKMLPSDEQLDLLAQLTSLTSEAIQEAISHTSNTEKQDRLGVFSQQLEGLLSAPIQSLNYEEFFNVVGTLKDILSSSKCIAGEHRDIGFRQALSFLNINSQPRSLSAAQASFDQAEQLLSRIGDGSRENHGDSKSMGRRR